MRPSHPSIQIIKVQTVFEQFRNIETVVARSQIVDESEGDECEANEDGVSYCAWNGEAMGAPNNNHGTRGGGTDPSVRRC